MQRLSRFACGLLLLTIGCAPSPPPVAAPIEKFDLAGLHNTFRVNSRLYSGSEPEGDAGFASLKSIGIRTVISVDGAEPDITKARGAGLTYIHLPVGYDGIPEPRRLELLQAFRSVDGPVYVHCHHGKHRGPAACTVLMMGTDNWTRQQAKDWLKMAGTDERYRGLFGLPDKFRKPSDNELSPRRGAFPEVAAVPDLTKRMVGVDHHWASIRTAKETGWKTTDNTADTVLLLMQDYREAQRLKDTGERMKKLLAEAEMTAIELEKAVRSRNVMEAEKQFTVAAGQCVSCHRQERDNR
jgi:protein tyrosine phosphatase (PTP) superfamily phosphohydrolase (DUF442 family)